MRFNEKKYTLLEFVRNKKFYKEENVCKCGCLVPEFVYSGDIDYYKLVKNMDFLKTDFKELSNQINVDDIYYFSESIHNVFQDKKFWDLLLKKSLLINDEKGVFLTKNVQILFQFSRNDDDDIDISFFSFSLKGGLSSVGYYTLDTKADSLEYATLDSENNLGDSLYFLMYLLKLIVFKQFIETEITIINSGAKKILNNQKCLNEFKYNVNIIDINYFKTSIRDTEFTVNGHLRLQPFGTERKKSKLIWINSFKKNGYVKRSRKKINNLKELLIERNI